MKLMRIFLLIAIVAVTSMAQTGVVRYQDAANAAVVNPGDSTNKAVRVNCITGCAGGGGGGTSSTFGAAFPATGTAVGASDGVNMRPLNVDGSGNLKVLAAQTGSWVVGQSGAWNVGLLAGVNLVGKFTISQGGNDATVRSLTNAKPLDVAITDANGNQITSFGASFTDNTGFTAGTTGITVTGGVFNDGLAAVASGNGAAPRITSSRAIHTNLRDNSGAEAGTSGNPLRVDPTGSTAQPVSGTVSAVQSGTWTVQPGNTANTTPWLATINQGGNSAAVTGANALKVDGSAVTQPVSGTVTSNQGTAAAGSGAWPVAITNTGDTIVKPGDSVNNAMRVNCVTGCGSSSFSDNSAFTFGTTGVNVTAFVVDDVSPNSVAENSAGAPRMSTNRVAYSQIRDAAGNERGVNVTVANALVVDGSAATQPVSGTVTVQQATASSLNAQVVGPAASGAAKSGNPVQTGAVFNTTQPTVTNGQIAEAQATARGGLIVATGTDTFNVAVSSVPGNQSINLAQVGGATVLTGNGTAGAGAQRITIASDNTAFTVNAAQSGTWTTRAVGNAGGVFDAAGQNAASPANEILTGCQFNTTPTTIASGNMSPCQVDNAGNLLTKLNAALPAGANTIGAVTQASGPWTMNLTQANGNTLLTGNGVTGSGSPRVTIASDNTAFAVNATLSAETTKVIGTVNQGTSPWIVAGGGTAGTAATGVVTVQGIAGMTKLLVTPDSVALPANQSVNVAQFGGTNIVTGTGASGSGIPRVTISNDSSLAANQSVNVAQIAGTNTVTAAAGVQRVGIAGNANATLDSTVGAGTAPTNALAVAALYNTSAPAPTNGQAMAIQADQAGNQRMFPGQASATLSAWTSATALNATQNIFTNSGAAAVLLHLVQTSTLTAGAVNFEVSYDGTNWVTIPADAVLDPSSTTFAQIATPYTVQASTNKPFLLMGKGWQGLRIKLTTQITGTGSVTPNYSLLANEPGQSVIALSPTAANFLVTASQSGTWANNVTQFGGTNISTGTGAGGAGIPRVTISNDSSLAANQSVNTNQIGGTAILTGNGVTGAGSQRVTIASDNTAFSVNATLSAETTKVIGTVRVLGNTGATVDSAPAATAPTNTVQVGGTFTTTPTTLTTGQAGSLQLTAAQNLKTDMTTVAGTATVTAAAGVQKVGIVGNANATVDSAPAATAPTNVLQVGGTFTTTPTTLTTGQAGALQLTAAQNLKTDMSTVAGTATSTAAAGVQKVGVVGNANGAFDQATGSAVPANALYIGGNGSGNLKGVIACDNTAVLDMTTATTTQVVAASGSTTVYVCAVSVEVNGTTTVTMKYGTGTNCGTGTTNLSPAWDFVSQTGIVEGNGLGMVYKTTASQALCFTNSAAVNTHAHVAYTQF